jgi:hypothetical protein
MESNDGKDGRPSFNLTKLFFVVSDNSDKVFVHGKTLQPSLKFARV